MQESNQKSKILSCDKKNSVLNRVDSLETTSHKGF